MRAQSLRDWRFSYVMASFLNSNANKTMTTTANAAACIKLRIILNPPVTSLPGRPDEPDR